MKAKADSGGMARIFRSGLLASVFLSCVALGTAAGNSWDDNLQLRKITAFNALMPA